MLPSYGGFQPITIASVNGGEGTLSRFGVGSQPPSATYLLATNVLYYIEDLLQESSGRISRFIFSVSHVEFFENCQEI